MRTVFILILAHWSGWLGLLLTQRYGPVIGFVVTYPVLVLAVALCRAATQSGEAGQ